MKLQFDPDLDFQREAIAWIVGIFQGQEACRTNSTVVSLKREKGWLEGIDQKEWTHLGRL